MNSNISAVEFAASIPSADYPAKSVLIVEEINEEWTRLLTPYLPPTDPDFIQQHFNRLDESSGGGHAAHAGSGSECVHIADMSQHHAPAAKVAGFHLDGIRTVQSLRCQENRPIQPWSAAETGMCFLKSASARLLGGGRRGGDDQGEQRRKTEADLHGPIIVPVCVMLPP